MQSVTLSWSPQFNVGKAHNLDSMEIHTTFPNVPDVGEMIHVSAYELTEGQKPQNLGDHYTFIVKRREYYWETPGNQPEVVVKLDLQVNKDVDPDGYESDACDVMLQVYGWKPLE